MMGLMRRRLLALLLLLAFCSAPATVVAQAPTSRHEDAWAPSTWAELDTAARDAVAAGEVPGAVILVGRGERVLYRKGLGSRALVPAVEPMTVDTIFDLASLDRKSTRLNSSHS